MLKSLKTIAETLIKIWESLETIKFKLSEINSSLEECVVADKMKHTVEMLDRLTDNLR